ncbi:hypothetical protein QQM79_18670 [Marinobacteraceae bacterium S3BR75-40.1]
MGKKILRFLGINLLISLVIGNAIAFANGAWPVDFPPIPYTESDQAFMAELKKEAAADTKDPLVFSTLGALYTLHNDIDSAHKALTQARQLDPDDPQILSWYSMNQTKRAGARLDLLMGLRKLYQLNQGIAGLNHAVKDSPDDAQLRLNRLATFVHLLDQSDIQPVVKKDIQWFKAFLAKHEKETPQAIVQTARIAMLLFNIHEARKDPTTQDIAVLEGQLDELREHKLDDPLITHQLEQAQSRIHGLRRS